MRYALAAGLAAAFFACASEPSGTLIKGQLNGAANLQAVLDEVQVGQTPKQLATVPIATDGTFKFGFLEELQPGLYQVKVGAQSAMLVLDDDDNRVEITGDLATLNAAEYSVTGSEDSEDLGKYLRELAQPRIGVDRVQEIVNEVESPKVAAYLAYSALQRLGVDGLPVLEAATARLDAGDPAKQTLNQFVSAIQQQQSARRATERIQVGQPAPDIALNSPDGQTYRLSDLKGQVVLLDFWASWCKPCRNENPNVVKVYDKYKDDGFTIYSVSLDGLDQRRTAGLDASQVARATENSKQRWVKAIQDDQLVWPYHVSELKKWDSTPGREYGVRGIPRTFLIDRDGKIAAVGLRGAAQIESALQKVI